MKNRIIKNTIINMLATFAGYLLSFILVPFIIRHIGGEAYGVWTLAGIFSISGWFSLLDLGMQGSAVKYIAEYYARRDYENLNKLINSVLFLFIIIGVFLAVLLFLFTKYYIFMVFNIPTQYLRVTRVIFYLMAFNLVVQFPGLLFSAVLEGIQRYDILRIVNVIINIVGATLIVIFLSIGYGLLMLTMLTIITTLLNILFYVYFIARAMPFLRFDMKSFDLAMFKRLFGLSWTLIVSRLVGLIFNNTDKIVIGILLTMSLMTSYDIVNKIHVTLLGIMAFFNSAIVPAASELSASNNNDSLQKLFMRGTKYAIGITLPITVSVIIMAKPLIIGWVGLKYGNVSPLLQLYLLHIFLTVTTGIGSTMLVGMNQLKPALRISFTAAIINLLFSVAFAKIIGLYALIGGTVLAYFIAQPLYLFYLLKILDISWDRFFKEVIIGPYFIALLYAFSLFLVTKLFWPNNLIEVLLFGGTGTAIYLFFYYRFSLSEQEKLLANSLISNVILVGGRVKTDAD